MNGLYWKKRRRKAKRFAARQKFNLWNNNCIDKKLRKRHIDFIRVAARFFSGVPHPHLLGVCCPDFHTSKSANSPEAKLDARKIFF
ncbi:MAG TPA: hypothetical protein VIK35_12380 [Verrucomicrobiae bacterium]